MTRFLRLISRSLVGKFIALGVMFMIIPAILYMKFAKADAERQDFLLRSLQIEGRHAAEALEPILTKIDGRSLHNAAQKIGNFPNDQVRIKLLLRPSGQSNAFFLVAVSPASLSTDLDQERQRLSDTGILARLDESCAGTKPLAVHYAASSGKDELLTSISPLHTNAGCWVIITSYGLEDLAGSSLARPFSEAPEVRLAMLLYAAIILLTVMAVIGTMVDLRSFTKLARQIRQGGKASAETFSEVTAIPELIPVAGEFDRMVDTLNASARAMCEAAEDNVHAFKGPIAALTQSIEPLRHPAKDDPRARQALEVIEQTLTRLTDLVQGVQRLDETAANLINASLQNIDLTRLTRDMADAFQRVHGSHGIQIVAKETGKAWVTATEDSLETVLENLLDNAVDFSPEGGTITMTVTTVDSMVRLIVEDEGLGVPVDQLELIFRRNFSSRPVEGRSMQMDTPHFGIGLAIVRRTVEILGGHIRAENRPEGGLKITIDFPAA